MRFALGVGETVIYPAANQFVASWVPQQERGVVNGLIFAGVGVGSGLTPPLLTWIIIDYGWRAAFWFSAILGMFAGAIWWVFARDTPAEHPGVLQAESREIREGLTHYSTASSVKPSSEKGKVSWRAIFSRADLGALMIGYFCFGYIAWIFFSWFYLYMSQVRELDLKASAYFTMLPFLCMTIFCLAGGALSDRLTRNHGLRIGRCMLASLSLFVTALLLIYGSRVHSPQYAGIILALGAGALYLVSKHILVRVRGHCRQKFRSFCLARQYERPDRRGHHFFLDPMAGAALRLDDAVYSRGSACIYSCVIMAGRSS